MNAAAPDESELALLEALALPATAADTRPGQPGWWSWRGIRADPRTYPVFRRQPHQAFHAAGQGLVRKGLARRRTAGSGNGWTEYQATGSGLAWIRRQEQETGT